jgi:hypothetical protein
MSPRQLLACALLVPAALTFAARLLPAQQAADETRIARGDCAYAACALGIAPRWNGLAVVRGVRGPEVANLHFFWPRDVTAAFRSSPSLAPGADSALAQARRAVRLRRIGATLTDGGLLVAAIGAVGALREGRVRRLDGVLLGIGGAALGLSVPFQFAADGALSRAVWWHNARFAR